MSAPMVAWETCMACGGRCGELRVTRPAERPEGIPLASEWLPCVPCGGGGRELVARISAAERWPGTVEIVSLSASLEVS